ncbi:tetratricopeptide repeat protein [Roseicyclus sp.]|uniref:tetratricopeptide repeat protein n=1 Tax=Roseicyclus sp. TaxID=1914329 RepID=UPI003F6B816D
MARESPGPMAVRIGMGGPASAWGTGASMARQSAFDEQGMRADGQAGPHCAAQTPEMLQIAMRAHLARGALAHARAAADRFAPHIGQASGLGPLVEAALEMGYVQLARLALADGDATAPPEEAALIRARIAQAQGDLVAARAILIAAIEAMPDHPATRRALAEVMVATGTAADARAVLAHLGARPGASPTE